MRRERTIDVLPPRLQLRPRRGRPRERAESLNVSLVTAPARPDSKRLTVSPGYRRDLIVERPRTRRLSGERLENAVSPARSVLDSRSADAYAYLRRSAKLHAKRSRTRRFVDVLSP